MKRKFLITTLVSMSLLSLNLFAGSHNCSGGFCMVDLSKNSPSTKKQELKIENNTIKEDIVKKDSNEYKTILVDNIETIVLPHSKYIITDLEVTEYDLLQMQDILVAPALDSDNLPTSDYFCDDNLKVVEVLGMEDTYECT